MGVVTHRKQRRAKYIGMAPVALLVSALVIECGNNKARVLGGIGGGACLKYVDCMGPVVYSDNPGVEAK